MAFHDICSLISGQPLASLDRIPSEETATEPFLSASTKRPASRPEVSEEACPGTNLEETKKKCHDLPCRSGALNAVANVNSLFLCRGLNSPSLPRRTWQHRGLKYHF